MFVLTFQSIFASGINMSSIDLRNWDDYYFSFNQTFALLDADWTDPKRFPKGTKI